VENLELIVQSIGVNLDIIAISKQKVDAMELIH
jgi:hypothetical protein